MNEIWLIYRIWEDSLENNPSDAAGYSVECWCETEEEANRLIEEAGLYQGNNWATAYWPKPVYIRTKMKILRAKK